MSDTFGIPHCARGIVDGERLFLIFEPTFHWLWTTTRQEQLVGVCGDPVSSMHMDLDAFKGKRFYQGLKLGAVDFLFH